METINWTPIILGIIALISAIFTTIVKPLVQKKIEEAKANMTAQQRETLDYWLTIMIAAAESVYIGANLGEKKATWVIEQLHKLDLMFDEATVRTAIMGMCRDLTAKGVINTSE